MTNLQTQIQNHRWEKCNCQLCHHGSKNFDINNCSCQGSGFEPMEIENPLIEDKTWLGTSKHFIPKYKENEIIEMYIDEERELSGLGLRRLNQLKKFQFKKCPQFKTGWGVISNGND